MKKQKKIRGVGGVVDTLTADVLPAALGYLAGEVLTKQLTFLSNNPVVGGAVKVGAGLFLSTQGGMMRGFGIGMAANGGVGIILPTLKQSGIALLPPGDPARLIAGIPVPQAGNPVTVAY